MNFTACELREKDVINVCNGQNLGYVTDLEIDVECGRITALMVSRDSIVAQIFSKKHVRVPWDKIKRIGKDTILVDLPAIGDKKCKEHEENDRCCDENKCDQGHSKWRRFG